MNSEKTNVDYFQLVIVCSSSGRSNLPELDIENVKVELRSEVVRIKTGLDG